MDKAIGDQNQHYVPRFLVRNFADEDGRVFCLNKQTDEITKETPKKVASSIGFYDFDINGRKVSFEKRLERIETQAAPVIRKIVRLSSLSRLSNVERNRIANFIAAQSFRTEAFLQGLVERPSKEQRGAVFAQLWRSAFLVANEVVRRQWVLMKIEDDAVYYLGDHPVVLQHTEKPSSSAPLGFDIKGAEVFLPLAPKWSLYMPCRSISKQIIAGYEDALFLHRRIRTEALAGRNPPGTDAATLFTVQRVLRSGFAIYESLVKGVVLISPPETIVNLNYLQCAWAHRQVFSNRGDFAFAKRVLKETPQYRNSPRTSLAPTNGLDWGIDAAE